MSVCQGLKRHHSRGCFTETDRSFDRDADSGGMGQGGCWSGLGTGVRN